FWILRAPALASRPTSSRNALSASWALPSEVSSRFRAAGGLAVWRLRGLDLVAVRLRALDLVAVRLRALERDPDFAAAMVDSPLGSFSGSAKPMPASRRAQSN